MRPFALLIATAFVAACAQQPVAAPPAPAHRTGVFEMTFTTGTTTMTGLIVARADTMEVRLNDGNCRRPLDETAPTSRMNFTCNSLADVSGLNLSISRNNPEQDSRWSGTVPRRATTRKCTAYAPDEKGRQVCVSQEAIVEEFDVAVGGVLRVRYKTPIS
jgi:hypothetical protein